jgi:RNA polymerase sigma factor (sigma-70 family)
VRVSDTGTCLSQLALDPEQFEAFYRRHVTAVTRFIARRLDDPHRVADLTADVFIAVIGAASGYRPALGSERGWLYGIARNVVAADRRRACRDSQASRRIAGRRLLDADDIEMLEERIDAEGAGRAIYQALANLPEDQRAVLELVALDGLKVSDAAAVLGISPGAARVRLHRARRHAIAELGPPAPIRERL